MISGCTYPHSQSRWTPPPYHHASSRSFAARSPACLRSTAFVPRRRGSSTLGKHLAYTRLLVASPFGILFEAVGACGCVGVSVGAEGSSAPLAGSLAGGSKGVLCAVMIWGRTREVRKGVLVGGWGIGGEEVRSPSSSFSTTADRDGNGWDVMDLFPGWR